MRMVIVDDLVGIDNLHAVLVLDPDVGGPPFQDEEGLDDSHQLRLAVGAAGGAVGRLPVTSHSGR